MCAYTYCHLERRRQPKSKDLNHNNKQFLLWGASINMRARQTAARAYYWRFSMNKPPVLLGDDKKYFSK